MGLLDYNPNPDSGFNEALLAAAQALLTPRHQGGGMGAAFGAFPRQMGLAQEQARRNKMMGLQEQQFGLQNQQFQYQVTEAQRKQAEAEAAKRQFEAVVGSLPPDQQKVARMLGPEYFKNMAPQAPKLETLYTDDGQEQKAWLTGPGSTPQPVGGAKRAPMPWEYETGPDGQPRMRQGVFDAKRQIAAAGAGKGVNFIQEKEEDKAVGKAFGEKYVAIQNAGFSSQSRIAKLDRMEQLLDGLETGRLTPAMTNVRAALKSFGIDLGGNVQQAEAVAALSNEMALAARSTEGGAGMPGAMSDKDREFLVEIVPGLSKTAGGNKLLIETNRRIAKRDAEIAKIARDYRKKNGKLDEGFYDELQAHANANPLFGDLQQATQGGVSTGGASGQWGTPAAPAASQGWRIREIR